VCLSLGSREHLFDVVEGTHETRAKVEPGRPERPPLPLLRSERAQPETQGSIDQLVTVED
jgi:hypothetical protein